MGITLNAQTVKTPKTKKKNEISRKNFNFLKTESKNV